MKRQLFVVLIIAGLLTLSSCGRLVRGASSTQRTDPSTLWVILDDFSLSIGPKLRRSFENYFEDNVFLSIHPGDRVIVGKIGSHPLSSFDILAARDFPAAFFHQPPVLSWQFVSEDPDSLQRACIAKFHTFVAARGNFTKIAAQQLSQPSTDGHTCLIDTINLVAANFAQHGGGKVLVMATDGLEDCEGLDFASHPPNAKTLRAVKAEGRIPNLSGVVVYFLCRNDHPPVPYQTIDGFWRMFFRAAGAKSVFVGPDLTFDYQSPATLRSQCGQ